MCEGPGCTGGVGKASVDEAAAAGRATCGVSGAETNGSDGNKLRQAGVANAYSVPSARGGPGHPEAPGYAGHPSRYGGQPIGYAGVPIGYPGHFAYPGFPGAGWEPGIKPCVNQAVPRPAMPASAVQGGVAQSKRRRRVPQGMKPPVKRGHGSSHNLLNQKIREQMRHQQSEGTLVVKVEPKVRNPPKHNAPAPRKLALYIKEEKTSEEARDADVYLPPDTAACHAAIIMASTPGIVVSGTSEPLPKIDLEQSIRQPEDAWKRSPTAVDTMETAARVAEALIGLRDAPGLQESLIQPLERHTNNKPDHKEDEPPGSA